MGTTPCFDEVTFEHFPREENQLADSLATMSSMFKVKWDNEAPRITIEIFDEPAHCYELDTDEQKPWYHEVKRYIKAQEYPEGASINDKKFLWIFSSKFFLSNGILYKRNHDSTLLWCMDKKEEDKIMEDMHGGIFGTHSSGHTMAKNILRAGYYWLIMETDCHYHLRIAISARFMSTKFTCL